MIEDITGKQFHATWNEEFRNQFAYIVSSEDQTFTLVALARFEFLLPI